MPSLRAGTLGETTVLANLLRTRTEIKPNMTGANWEYTDESPWPPVQRILKTVFWTADIYSSIRERISRPAPVVELEEKADYITVRTTDVRSSPVEEELNLEVHAFTAFVRSSDLSFSKSSM